MTIRQALRMRFPPRPKRILGVVLCLLTLVTLAGSADNERFEPFLETYPDGWIDWQQSVIYGVGKGYLHLNGDSKNRAQRAARVLAMQSILKVAAGVRLDDRQTLERLGQGTVVVHLKAFLRFSEDRVSFKADDPSPHYEVILKAPLTGIEGLTFNLLTHLKSTPQVWRDFPLKTDETPSQGDEDLPWLLLDARRLAAHEKVQPAMFPKVVSAAGETLYELKGVDERALVQRGMASYVLSDEPPEKLRAETGSLAHLKARIDTLLTLREAVAGEQPRKKRRRFIVTEVQAAQGMMRTNLVISEKDARELSEENASSEILKKCRVIVIAASPIGGIEGRAATFLAQLQEP